MGENLKRDVSRLRKQQKESRTNHKTSSNPTDQNIKPGDMVTNISSQPKHNACEMYLVTSKQKEVTLQKILHPLTNTDTKFMSREYITDPKWSNFSTALQQQTYIILTRSYSLDSPKEKLNHLGTQPILGSTNNTN